MQRNHDRFTERKGNMCEWYIEINKLGGAVSIELIECSLFQPVLYCVMPPGSLKKESFTELETKSLNYNFQGKSRSGLC